MSEIKNDYTKFDLLKMYSDYGDVTGIQIITRFIDHINEQFSILNITIDEFFQDSEVMAWVLLRLDEMIEQELILKVDKTDYEAYKIIVNDALDAINLELATKADKTIVNDALDLKADKTFVNDALDLKADKTVMATQLALKADKTDMTSKLNKKLDIEDVFLDGFIGEYKLPEDFFIPSFPISIYKDNQGYKSEVSTYFFAIKTYYVSHDGSNSNDGSKESPYQTLEKAISEFILVAGSFTTLKIIILSEFLTRESAFMTNLNDIGRKHFILESQHPYKTLFGGFEAPKASASWNQVSGTDSTYWTSETKDITGVIDLHRKGIFNLNRSLKEVNTVNVAQNEWYKDTANNRVYVNVGRPIESNVLLNIRQRPMYFEDFGRGTIMLKNLNFNYHTADNVSLSFTNATEQTGKVVIENCILNMNNTGSDGFKFNNIFESYISNTGVMNTVRDGFNYHNSVQARKMFNFESNCWGYNCGASHTTFNNNITSCHDNSYMLRVGTKGNLSRGSLLADVNDTYSINIGVEMGDSLLTDNPDVNYSFAFRDMANGKVIMHDCQGGSRLTKALDTDDLVDLTITKSRLYNDERND